MTENSFLNTKSGVGERYAQEEGGSPLVTTGGMSCQEKNDCVKNATLATKGGMRYNKL